ncbi:hypothetical protein BH11ACT7_BH11ACT7_33390 [soil metagenome]
MTSGEQPTTRFAAPDLQQAQRVRRSLPGVAVLELTVVVADGYRSAQQQLSELGLDTHDRLSYAGTLDGLAGLVADIFVAGVADGVALIPAAPGQDARALGEEIVTRVAARLQTAA